MKSLNCKRETDPLSLPNFNNSRLKNHYGESAYSTLCLCLRISNLNEKTNKIIRKNCKLGFEC